MIESLILIGLLLAVAIVSGWIKGRRLREIQAMFIRYNKNQDKDVIVSWIREKKSAARMLNTLDYLQKIEEEDLALAVYDAFGFDAFPNRHNRVFACRAFKKLGRKKEALQLAALLLEAYPKDDSMLDLYLDVHLHFGEADAARPKLMQRLERKFKGTAFPRHYARLLALDGDLEKAVTIMENVVKREFALAKNTLAPLSKKLIYAQYEESQKLLDGFQEKLDNGMASDKA